MTLRVVTRLAGEEGVKMIKLEDGCNASGHLFRYVCLSLMRNGEERPTLYRRQKRWGTLIALLGVLAAGCRHMPVGLFSLPAIRPSEFISPPATERATRSDLRHDTVPAKLTVALGGLLRETGDP